MKMKENPKDQKAFYKEYQKRFKKAETDYCMEDFAFDLFVENKDLNSLKKILNVLSMIEKD